MSGALKKRGIQFKLFSHHTASWNKVTCFVPRLAFAPLLLVDRDSHWKFPIWSCNKSDRKSYSKSDRFTMAVPNKTDSKSDRKSSSRSHCFLLIKSSILLSSGFLFRNWSAAQAWRPSGYLRFGLRTLSPASLSLRLSRLRKGNTKGGKSNFTKLELYGRYTVAYKREFDWRKLRVR